jgi:DNA (cytosine-5)-methyltransferase 1
VEVPDELATSAATGPFHTGGLCRAVEGLPAPVRDRWVWWRLPSPRPRTATFADLVEEAPSGVEWHTEAQTKALLDLMSSGNLAKVEAAKADGRRRVGGVYRRTRADGAGGKTQRAEVRFDDIAGCLRTPAGGSSRQTILVVDGRRVRSRLISARETARLMGLDDRYVLPRRYNDAYHLTGDGVVAPVVRHLATHLFEPLAQTPQLGRRVA